VIYVDDTVSFQIRCPGFREKCYLRLQGKKCSSGIMFEVNVSLTLIIVYIPVNR